MKLEKNVPTHVIMFSVRAEASMVRTNITMIYHDFVLINRFVMQLSEVYLL